MNRKKIIAFLFLSVLFMSGCAGTGVALKVPPFKDDIPEISTGFYSVYKIVDGKVSKPLFVPVTKDLNLTFT